MTYVFALSLGPVQDFIVASRRTRDLWFGSYLLSQASLAAAQALRAQGAQLIFPAAETLDAGEDARGNVSNKILAVVTASEEDLRVLAQRACRQRGTRCWHWPGTRSRTGRSTVRTTGRPCSWRTCSNATGRPRS